MTNIIPITPANGYISLPVTTDPSALLQAAILAIATAFPGWVPQEGQLDLAILEQNAQMSSESAVVAAQMPLTAFQYLGQLFGVNPQNGVAATALTTWTMINSNGYTVPAGTIVAYQITGNTQVQFVTVTALTVPFGSTVATAVEIEAQVIGTVYNAIPDTTPIVPVQQLAFVASIVATTATAGGIDPETITNYIDRLSNLFEITTPDPVLPNDFAILAQSATDSNGNLLGVFRALAINLFNPGRTITGTITLNATTALEDTAGSFTPDDVGRTVTGTDIPSSTTISAYVSATQATMNNAASGSETLGTVTLGDLTNAERCVAVCGVTSAGTALTSTVAGELSTYLEARREVNFLVPVIAPTFTQIDVTWTGVALIGYTTAAVQAAGNAIIDSFLSPALWAGGNLVPPMWQPGDNVVHYTALVQALAATLGLAYLETVTFCIHGGTLATTDITLPGQAPLPQPGTISGAVTT